MVPDKYEYTFDGSKFVNPYNFVKQPEKVDRVAIEKRLEGASLSGYLNCSLEAKSVLAFPDYERGTEDKETKGHMRYPTMRRVGDGDDDDEKQLMIPGSSLRGVFRSVYETITGSCFSTIKDNTRMTARTSPQEAFEPALLMRENGKWVLYEAERHLVCFNERVKSKPKDTLICKKAELYGYIITDIEDNKNKHLKVYFLSEKDAKTKRYFVTKLEKERFTGCKEGYLFIGEDFDDKKCESVFARGKKVQIGTEELQVMLRDLEESISVYRNSSINRSYKANDGYVENEHSGYQWYEAAKKSGCIPLWKHTDGNITYLSMASIGRRTYRKSLNEILKNVNRCKDREKVLCPACSLFGMIGSKGTKAIGGRVRITDAYSTDTGKLSEVTLKELSTPRISYIPFYCDTSKGVVTYDNSKVRIRGRKYYWHNLEKNYETNEKTERNATMELIKPQTSFSFRVYFDGVTKEELDKLIWVITLGENKKDSNLCLKFGHGKPLGLGSAKTTISEVVKRTYDGTTYALSTDKECKVVNLLETNSETYEQLVKICGLREMENYTVRYPYVENKSYDKSNKPNRKSEDETNVYAAHQWFTNNWQVGKQKEEQPLLSLKNPGTLKAVICRSKNSGGEKNDEKNEGDMCNNGNKQQETQKLEEGYNNEEIEAKVVIVKGEKGPRSRKVVFTNVVNYMNLRFREGIISNFEPSTMKDGTIVKCQLVNPCSTGTKVKINKIVATS